MNDEIDLFKIWPALLNSKNSSATVQFIEDYLYQKKIDKTLNNFDKLIYIGGYARSRSTFLLNQFYNTGIFCSLKYSHFPFITSPIISNKISKLLYSNKSINRAHGDGLKINLNSPESFEEIFWSGELESYFNDNYLREIKEYNTEVFKNYFNLLKKIKFLHKNDLYLCKSNYFFLRSNIFDQEKINFLYFVTIRNPISQIKSLLNQHLKFTNYGYKNVLIGKYLNSIGKYDFGYKRKPILLDNGKLNKISLEYFYKNDNLNYYLSQWIIVYEFILNLKNKNPSKIFFVDLSVESTLSSFEKLKEINGIDYRVFLKNISDNLIINNESKSDNFTHVLDKDLKEISLSLYKRFIN